MPPARRDAATLSGSLGLSLAVNATVRGELRLAREVSEHLLQRAQTLQDTALQLEAYLLSGALAFWLREVEEGRAQLERGLTLADAHPEGGHTFLYGHDARVVCRVLLAKALWLLGYPEQARRQSKEALDLAHAAAHPYSVVFALNWLTMLHLELREYHFAREYAATAVTLAHTQGFPHLEAVVSVLQGGTLTTLGDATIGIRRIREGLTACQTTGAILARPYLLALLAEAHACAGQHDEARDVLNDALAVADSTGKQWYTATLHCLYGEVLLRARKQTNGPREKTEALFQSR